MFRSIPAILVCLFMLPGPVRAQDSNEVVEAMEEYFDFVEYGGATIFPGQIPAADWKNFFVIDARDAAQFQGDHIPGAVHIEWRQVLASSSELPDDEPILIYCNTGPLPAQAGFALRVAGYENVRILQGGLREWKEKGGFEANERALSSQQDRVSR